MTDPRIRYCQRCSRSTFVNGADDVAPCKVCGGTQFDRQPKRHSAAPVITEDDKTFLRVQGIRWEDDEDSA